MENMENKVKSLSDLGKIVPTTSTESGEVTKGKKQWKKGYYLPSALPHSKKLEFDDVDSPVYESGVEFVDAVEKGIKDLIHDKVIKTYNESIVDEDDAENQPSTEGIAIMVANPITKLPCKVDILESSIAYGNMYLRRGGHWDWKVLDELVDDLVRSEPRRIKVYPNSVSKPNPKPVVKENPPVKKERTQGTTKNEHRVAISATGKVVVVVPSGTEVVVEYM